MNSSGDFNVQNFRSIIEKYENAIQDVTKELDVVQAEHNTIRGALKENSQLSAQLNKILADKINSAPTDHKYKENQLIENLQLQLKTLLQEKEQAVKLWQNAAATVDMLEAELRNYQDTTEGFVTKAKLMQIKKEYEQRIKELQNNVAITKNRLEDLIFEKTRELKSKDQEIAGSLHSQDNAFKIVKNLEEEILSLQHRLNEVNNDKKRLEKNLKCKGIEIESLKLKIHECRLKVEESLQVVEAAFNEKDAALLRETKAKEQISHLSKSLEGIITETKVKVRNIKTENDQKLDKVLYELKASQEEVKLYSKKCCILEEEIGKLQKGLTSVDQNGASKLLVLEKNLESTFQKLLLSEKQNIKFKSEMETIKNDLDQMAHHYERDIATREHEKNILREEIKKLKIALDDSSMKLTQNESTIEELTANLASMKSQFEVQIEEMKQEAIKEKELTEKEHKRIVDDLQSQVFSQTKTIKKWRSETKHIVECVERRMTELKITLNKVRQENKMLSDRLKDSNAKMFEYRQFLDLISKDVNKITSVALPEMGEMFSLLTTVLMDNKDHSQIN